MPYKPIKFKHKGELKKTTKFLNKILHRDYIKILDKYAQQGVEALRQYTPKKTGLTSESWGYTIEKYSERTVITWTNSNIQNYVNIALILQYGHATRNGGWVEGVDYINPALKPIFDKMAIEAWGEVIG